MLGGISFSNYRAFKTGQLKVRPLTIILGSNGVGKTSLMQLFLLLKQTAEAAGTNYRSPLRIQGKHVQFGDPINIFFNHDARRHITMQLHGETTELKNDLKGRLTSSFHQLIDEYSFYIYRSIEVSGKTETALSREFHNIRGTHRRTRSGKSRIIRDNSRSIIEYLKQYNEEIGSTISAHIPNIDPTSILAKGNFFRAPFTIGESQVNPHDLESVLSMLESLETVGDQDISISFQIAKLRGGGLSVREIKLIAGGRNLVSVSARHASRPATVRSEIISFPNGSFDVPSSISLLDHSATIFECVPPRSEKSSDFKIELVRHLLRLSLEGFRKQVYQELIQHVPPLRAYPKRYYFLDYAMPTSGGRDDAVVESLRENATLKIAVNKWLGRFGISVSVAQIEELIHKLRVAKGVTGFELDIADVGFGISQVLPVIVQCFLAKKESITLVEQPEIHLHPKMQSDLADLFIEACGADCDRAFIVETHSEYMLSRLRRRIAEGKISRDNVAIYFVEPDRSEAGDDISASVREIDISHDGAFDWPIEFFENDLEDTISFLKLRGQQN